MDNLLSASTLVGAAIGALGASAAPWPVKSLRRLLRGHSEREQRQAEAEAEREESEKQRLTVRVADLEDLIDTLRKALDKHLIRESAIASACELLITLAALVPRPTEAMLRIRDRAQQLLEDARAQTAAINSRGNA